ncbi:MAG: hypothetical protein RLZZ58_1785 [Pseudomonadota bacterium]
MPELKLSPLTHIASLLAAIFISTVTLWTTTATAATTPYYSAELAAPSADAKLIVRGTVWKCEGATCVAGKAGSRPQIICATLVREVGRLNSFSVGGKAIEQAELDACNAKAA